MAASSFVNEERKIVFVSCGQYSEEERALGKRVAELVREFTPFDGYFAENQTTLATLTENVLRRLYESVGLIVIMHHRGTVETPGRKLTRASVWVEQEVAVATLMQQILKRPLHVALFVQEGIAMEGIRQQLQLNPVEFESSEEVIGKLRDTLPLWKIPRYIGDEELRAKVDSIYLSVRVNNGQHGDVTIDVENHSDTDAVIKSILLRSNGIRVCGPVPRPEGANWSIRAGGKVPIRFSAKRCAERILANSSERSLPVGNSGRLFFPTIEVKLRCEILGLERTFTEKSNVQVERLNGEITGIR
jgi:hypothetical protein